MEETTRIRFERDGFVLLKNYFSIEEYDTLIKEGEDLFHGIFPTKVYPDEWHFRHGISIPNRTKEIVNCWKSNKTFARFIMNPKLGEMVARLLNWPSVRLAQDDIIFKPPGGTAVGLHQDSKYISQNFQLPLGGENEASPLSVTVWVPLEEVDEENGAICYGNGSHLWKDLQPLDLFHVDETFSSKSAFAKLNPKKTSATLTIMKMKPGDIVIHHEDTWHCSGPNKSQEKTRRALAIHLIRGDVEFKDNNVSYIYGRYKLFQSRIVREEFFPTIWPPSDYVNWYLNNGEQSSRL